LALEDHEKALCESPEPTDEDLQTLEKYSEAAALSIMSHVPSKYWERKTGHISISNSACYEYSRGEGGRRHYVLTHLKEWLEGIPTEDKRTILPTGESVIERKGVPRRVTVRPPLMHDGSEDPMKVDSGLLTEDYEDSEQNRVGFKLLERRLIEL
jgi:hypothetical protein